MSTITCVYWLQSGRLFAERTEPDVGLDSVGTEYKASRPPSAGEMVTTHDVPAFMPALYLLTFEITEQPAIIAEQYALGRRRFHYCETSGWKSDEERMEEDVYGTAEWQRFSRRLLPEMMRQEGALLKAGAFPVHTCALPPEWTGVQLFQAACADKPWTFTPMPYHYGIIFLPKYLLPPDIS